MYLESVHADHNYPLHAIVKNTMSQQSLTVTIKSPSKVLFSGKALSITSENSVGTFDILPDHSNFISLIAHSVSLISIDSKTLKIPFVSGVIKCENNVVSMYIGV